MSAEPRYTLEELSQITSLTTRTLRNYIQKKLLQGEKENGKWYFTEENLTEFFSSDFVRQEIKSKHQTVVGNFLYGPAKQVPAGCFLYDLPGTQTELMELCKKVTKFLNQKMSQEEITFLNEIQFFFYYDEKHSVGRFALSGDLKLIGQVVALLQG